MARRRKDPFDGLLDGVGDIFGGDDLDLDLGLGGGGGVTPNRERHFNRESGRFHDPMSGEFEIGGPPPDLDASVDRYRAKNGRFKNRSADLYDEPLEAELDALWPKG